MKNQNDLIVSIVAAVLGIGFSLAFFFMKRDPIQPAAPQQVVTTALAYPAAVPVMANALPSGGTNSAGGGSPFGSPGGFGSGNPFGPGGPGMMRGGPPGGMPGGMGGGAMGSGKKGMGL